MEVKKENENTANILEYQLGHEFVWNSQVIQCYGYNKMEWNHLRSKTFQLHQLKNATTAFEFTRITWTNNCIRSSLCDNVHSNCWRKTFNYIHIHEHSSTCTPNARSYSSNYKYKSIWSSPVRLPYVLII